LPYCARTARLDSNAEKEEGQEEGGREKRAEKKAEKRECCTYAREQRKEVFDIRQGVAVEVAVGVFVERREEQ